jgi:hypothetical protein
MFRNKIERNKGRLLRYGERKGIEGIARVDHLP